MLVHCRLLTSCPSVTRVCTSTAVLRVHASQGITRLLDICAHAHAHTHTHTHTHITHTRHTPHTCTRTHTTHAHHTNTHTHAHTRACPYLYEVSGANSSRGTNSSTSLVGRRLASGYGLTCHSDDVRQHGMLSYGGEMSSLSVAGMDLSLR